MSAFTNDTNEDIECEESRFVVPEDLITKPKLLSLGSHRGMGAATFTIKTYNKKLNKSAIDCYVSYVDGLRTVQYTRNEFGSMTTQPILYQGLLSEAIDQLLYLKQGNIYSLPLNGGEAFKVSDFPVEIQSFKLFQSPDQSLHMALVMDVYPSLSPAETAARDAAESSGPHSSGIVFDKLMVRHWDNWGTYTKRNHVFVCPVEITANGFFSLNVNHAEDLMFGLETDCPGKAPGLGEEEYSISPQGDRIALSFRRPKADGSQREDFAWCTDVAIYLVDFSPQGRNPDTSRYELKLVSGEDWTGYNSQPSFSPDGTKLAFLSMRTPKYESDKNNIRILDLATNSLSIPTADLSLSVGSIEWGLTGAESIYSTVQYRGVNRIFRFQFSHAEDGKSSLAAIHTIAGDESRSSPVIVPYRYPGASGRAEIEAIYYIESTLASPGELHLAVLDPAASAISAVLIAFDEFSAPPSGAGEVPLTSLHGGPRTRYAHQIYVPTPEFGNGDLTLSPITSHYFVGGGNDLVHAWYLPPPGLNAGEAAAASVPLLLIVHGGPQGAILNSWHYRWNLGIFAAMGYGVVAVNFHGSTGYGQEFCDSIRGDWGGKPYEDCLGAVDYVLGRYSYLDSTRVGALGASYGGYMMNWINGHTDRFRCLVNHDGIFSLRSLYYSTEELYFPEFEFGLPWEQTGDDNPYVRWSPDSFVAQWHTPTLVIQGGIDFRVGEAEAISTFTTLQRKGIPSKLLFFPDENHWVLKPLNSMKWHSTIQQWLAQWLQK